MEMSDAERVELGAKIRARRERAFGTKKAAYLEAGVNAATWDRAEDGEPVRGDRLRSIVRTLWPESQGDWTAIGEAAAAREPSLEDRVAELERLVRRLAGLDPTTPGGESGENHGQPGASA